METEYLIQERVRRSNRKTKKIDRSAIGGHVNQVRRRHLIESAGYGVGVEIQTKCKRWMQIDSNVQQEIILEEMGRAIDYQCQKLEQVLKIKLEIGQKKRSEKKECLNSLGKWPVASMIVRKLQEMQEDQELSANNEQLIDYWSCQEQQEGEPVLRRHESARLLCDNYEKQQLIYSVETLIPRLARQDIDQDLIERLH